MNNGEEKKSVKDCSSTVGNNREDSDNTRSFQFDIYDPKRLAALSDGIFAIVMTLLILDLKFPFVANTTSGELHRQLWGNLPKFRGFVVSFFLLAVFWIINHYHFKYIKRMDSKLLWINMVYLLLVCCLPFTTNLSSDYHNLWLPQVMFSGNIFLIRILANLNWWYATKNRRFVDPDLSMGIISSTSKLGLLAVVIYFIAFLSALLHHYSPIIYLAIPLILFMFRYKRK
ncbi:MAG: TMEM175 family protein [Candidatus Eremiobacteraeota bacterium]|nr:TMEM175 family protein [Candidatus Eremiobacteraeota bacterium]